MKSKITVYKVLVSDNKISYDWLVEGDIKECFKISEPLFYEYSSRIGNVPESIAVLPLLCNILPIVWLYDAELIVNEVDEAFFRSLTEVKKSFVAMYPMLAFKGNISVNRLVANRMPTAKSKTAVFFSGGVDSNFTLINHLEEHPALITLIGADVDINDRCGTEALKQLMYKASSQYDLDSVYVLSSFRRCLNYRKLDAKVAASQNGYWGGFQHGMAICGQAFPYAYEKGIERIYIASSRWVHDKDFHAWGSAPEIDSNLKFAAGCVIHDGYYEYNRQDKVKYISEYVERTGQNIDIHVCWETSGGENCCCCEKCFRTMFELLLVGADPNRYGFRYTPKTGLIMEKYFQHVLIIHDAVRERWIEMQKKYLDDKCILIDDQSFQWLKTFDFNKENADKIRLLRSLWKNGLRRFSAR